MDGKHFTTIRLGWTFQNGMLIPVETDIPVAPESSQYCFMWMQDCRMWNNVMRCRKLGLFCTFVCVICSDETCSNAQRPTFDTDEEESAAALLAIGDGDFEDEAVDEND